MIREIVDGENYRELGPTPKSIAISGKVESVDKLLTFCGIGFLSSLSDIFGRKVIMAWSAIGFALTNYLQAVAITLGKNPSTHHLAIPLVYVAKLIDGCSSCMLPLCQAYVTDCTPNEDQLATNLGIFSGLSCKYCVCVCVVDVLCFFVFLSSIFACCMYSTSLSHSSQTPH